MAALIRHSISGTFYRCIYTSCQLEAARKGTRERAKKRKVKVEIKKVGFIPHNIRNLSKLTAKRISPRSVDEIDEDPIDNVFFNGHYKTQEYGINDAIEFHKETHHPTMYNALNAPLNIVVELNMVAEKKTRFVDAFNRHVKLPHQFTKYDGRTVLAFCKTPEQIKVCEDSGADLAGGPELVKKIQTGDISLTDFRYVISHPSSLPDLVPIRGLLKNKFPSLKLCSLGPDLAGMVNLFKTGLQYSCEKDPYENDLAFVRASIGTLDMETNALAQNLETFLKDIESLRPKRSGDFITWVWCMAPPSFEKFKIAVGPILKRETNN